MVLFSFEDRVLVGAKTRPPATKMTSKKKYPKSFYDDGLGDILEWIDDEILLPAETGKRSANRRESQKNNPEADSETGRHDKKKVKVAKKTKLYGDNDLEEVLNRKSKLKPELESIGDDDAPAATKLNKDIDTRIRGLINRLAAQTMPYVSEQFIKLYSKHSRNELNASLYSNIQSSLLAEETITKRKLVAEFMLLVSYLDHKISHNIGATIVHQLVRQFEKLYSTSSNDEDKTLDNIIFCLVNLYIIGLISAHVIYELTRRICSSEKFRSKSVELLLIIIKNIGFQLRKDNPSLMRQLILMSNEQCQSLKDSSDVGSRIEFMIDAMSAIKNNNISKIGNYGCDIDKDTIESTLKGLLKRTRLPECLADASYAEILSSCNWYLLETRVDENENTGGSDENKKKEVIGSKAEAKVCKALGLNKPAERTIFGALIKVSDFVEASNIIIGYGLNHCSDAMVVLIHVAIFEKKYNPFYYNTINNLCKFNRKYKMAAKFAIQDKIRVLSSMPSNRVSILAKLSFELIQSDAIPITVLKSVDWANLNDSTKEYLVFLLQSISSLPEEERQKIMVKSDKKSSFAGAMRTFTNCFLEGCDLFD